jgi:hypothetical protein
MIEPEFPGFVDDEMEEAPGVEEELPSEEAVVSQFNISLPFEVEATQPMEEAAQVRSVLPTHVCMCNNVSSRSMTSPLFTMTKRHAFNV